MFGSNVSSDTTDTHLIYFCYLFSLAGNVGGRGCRDDFCFWKCWAARRGTKPAKNSQATTPAPRQLSKIKFSSAALIHHPG